MHLSLGLNGLNMESYIEYTSGLIICNVAFNPEATGSFFGNVLFFLMLFTINVSILHAKYNKYFVSTVVTDDLML